MEVSHPVVTRREKFQVTGEQPDSTGPGTAPMEDIYLFVIWQSYTLEAYHKYKICNQVDTMGMQAD